VIVDGANQSGVLLVPQDCSSNELQGDIYVGNRGTGSLSINNGNGATVNNAHAYVAAMINPTRPASSGTVTVSQNTIWFISNDGGCDAGLFIGCKADTTAGGTGLVWPDPESWTG